MRLVKIIAAAGLAITALAGATSASAQDNRDHRGDRDRYEHRWDRDDRGRHHGWNRYGRHCRTEWRHHHRVTICRR